MHVNQISAVPGNENIFSDFYIDAKRISATSSKHFQGDSKKILYSRTTLIKTISGNSRKGRKDPNHCWYKMRPLCKRHKDSPFMGQKLELSLTPAVVVAKGSIAVADCVLLIGQLRSVNKGIFFLSSLV